MSLCAAVSVAQAGLIAFVGLLAPHLARAWSRAEGGYRWHVLNASLAGGLLLALADVGSRGLMAPQDLPVGILTSVIGGVYLLARLYRRSRLEQGGLA
jgi:iron complex transport system permease protein